MVWRTNFDQFALRPSSEPPSLSDPSTILPAYTARTAPPTNPPTAHQPSGCATGIAAANYATAPPDPPPSRPATARAAPPPPLRPPAGPAPPAIFGSAVASEPPPRTHAAAATAGLEVVGGSEAALAATLETVVGQLDILAQTVALLEQVWLDA
jgi:hypothetical protein